MNKENLLFYSKYKLQTKIKILLALIIVILVQVSFFYNGRESMAKYQDEAHYYFLASMIFVLAPFILYVVSLDQVLVYTDHVIFRVQNGKRNRYETYYFTQIFTVTFLEGKLLFKFNDGSEKIISTRRLECRSIRGLGVSWERFAHDLQSRLKN